LDCVWQLKRQNPTGFEFNEQFLIYIIDNVNSCKFGTFLFNCEQERQKEQVIEKTVSIWTEVLEDIDKFKDTNFVPTDLLIPHFKTNDTIKLWEAYYLRYFPK